MSRNKINESMNMGYIWQEKCSTSSIQFFAWYISTLMLIIILYKLMPMLNRTAVTWDSCMNFYLRFLFLSIAKKLERFKKYFKIFLICMYDKQKSLEIWRRITAQLQYFSHLSKPVLNRISITLYDIASSKLKCRIWSDLVRITDYVTITGSPKHTQKY